MKKKLIVLLTLCVLIFSLISCDEAYEDAKQGGPYNDDWGNGYFTIVESWGGSGVSKYMVVYANDTKVMYFIDACSISGGITPLYNSDGTLQIYNGE